VERRWIEHPDDEKLLAFLDGELSKSETRVVALHLKRCWKCRTTLSDLESQVEDVSRLLLARTNADAGRSTQAMRRFLEWKSAFEGQQEQSNPRSHRFLMMAVGVARAQTTSLVSAVFAY
jgi:anti-sigma factor RsiW